MLKGRAQSRQEKAERYCHDAKRSSEKEIRKARARETKYKQSALTKSLSQHPRGDLKQRHRTAEGRP